MDRLEMLRRFVEQRPDDPFPRYGLAMELRKLQRWDECANAFKELCEAFPDYLPAYLMAGGVEVERKQVPAARAYFERGLELARTQSDEKALDELGAALAELP